MCSLAWLSATWRLMKSSSNDAFLRDEDFWILLLILIWMSHVRFFTSSKWRCNVGPCGYMAQRSPTFWICFARHDRCLSFELSSVFLSGQLNSWKISSWLLAGGWCNTQLDRPTVDVLVPVCPSRGRDTRSVRDRGLTRSLQKITWYLVSINSSTSQLRYFFNFNLA